MPGNTLKTENIGSFPVAPARDEEVTLGHGSGGRLSAQLLSDVFLPALGNDVLSRLEDQATLRMGSEKGALRLAFTTGSFVVRPLFFPGGDIGRLAVNGTVNALAVGGARPLYLSAAFILEEGLAITELQRVVQSMGEACREAGVILVTGDSKVVDRGKGDKLFISTSGVGLVPDTIELSISSARPGDKVLLSGTLADHGMAVLSVREGLQFETAIRSDTAALTPLAQAVLTAAPGTRVMRVATRGGLASTANELAAASNVGVRLEEASLPVLPDVRSACELFGLDPLYVANEGKLVAVVPPDEASRALAAMRAHPLGRDAAIVGEATAEHPGVVTMKSQTGGERMVTLLAGQQLPRIC